MSCCGSHELVGLLELCILAPIPAHIVSKIFNTCVVFGPDGSILVRHRKMHLFDIDIPGKIVFKESDTLTAGDQVSYFDFKKQRSADDSIDVAPVRARIGIGICYDMRFAELAQVWLRHRYISRYP